MYKPIFSKKNYNMYKINKIFITFYTLIGNKQNLLLYINNTSIYLLCFLAQDLLDPDHGSNWGLLYGLASYCRWFFP